MANIKSSEKRAVLQRKANERNRAERSLIKTSLKKFDTAVTEGDTKAAESAYVSATKVIDRAATKNLMHKNTAARRKRSMMRRLNALGS